MAGRKEGRREKGGKKGEIEERKDGGEGGRKEEGKKGGRRRPTEQQVHGTRGETGVDRGNEAEAT